MRIAAYVPDLMDRSRIGAVADRIGTEVVTVAAPGDLAGVAGAEMVVVDLGRPGVLEALSGLGDVASVGFASHVDRDLLRRARGSGCGQVLARSAFFGRLPELLAGAGGQSGP